MIYDMYSHMIDNDRFQMSKKIFADFYDEISTDQNPANPASQDNTVIIGKDQPSCADETDREMEGRIMGELLSKLL